MAETANGPTRPRLLASRPRLNLGWNSDRRTERGNSGLVTIDVGRPRQCLPDFPSPIIVSVTPSASKSLSLDLWTFSYPSFRTFVPSLFFVISKFGRFAGCGTCRQAGGLAG